MNLNKAICKPSEGIRIKSLTATRRNLTEFEKSPKISRIFDEVILCKLKKSNEFIEETTTKLNTSVDKLNTSRDNKKKAIDFYTLFGESKCNKKTCGEMTQISEKDLQEGDFLENTITDYRQTEYVNKQEKIDFIILGLKNDIRVRWHKVTGNEIIVRFWTVTDAISYYKQYISIVDMEFIELDEMDTWKIKEDVMDSKPVKNLVSKENRELNIKERREVFNGRVEIFESRRGFFTKFDVKRMETMRQSGKYEFLFENSKEIACGCASNVVMQEAVRYLDDNQLCELISTLGQDIAPLAATKHGAYAIQAVIASAQSQIAQKLICANFRKYGEFLVCHEIGNYAIQKVLLFDRNMVFELCMKNFEEIITNPLGVKIFRKSLTYFTEHIDEIEEALEVHMNEVNEKNCRMLLGIINENTNNKKFLEKENSNNGTALSTEQVY